MRRIAAILGVAVLALAVTATTAFPAASGPATVKARTTKLGKIVVDGSGRTLYLFEKDKGSKSSCSGACATNWPPLLTKGKPKAGSGVKASKLGTTRRADGTTQVTYYGHPLYRFKLDKKAGDTHGQGLTAFGAPWYVVAAATGKAITKTGSTAGTMGY
jgi:predicted lipoprotein with Yx(FWY)xxD motif